MSLSLIGIFAILYQLIQMCIEGGFNITPVYRLTIVVLILFLLSGKYTFTSNRRTRYMIARLALQRQKEIKKEIVDK